MEGKISSIVIIQAKYLYFSKLKVCHRKDKTAIQLQKLWNDIKWSNIPVIGISYRKDGERLEEGGKKYVSNSDWNFSSFLNVNSEIQEFQQTTNRKNPEELTTKYIRTKCFKNKIKKNFMSNQMWGDVLHKNNT